MIKRICGGCNFQGDSRLETQGVKILCLYDNLWHKNIDTCDRWCQYSYHMSGDERLKVATALRNNEAADRRHQESLKSAGLTRKLQIKVAVLSFLGGIITGILTTLITQWIMSLSK